VGVRAARLGSWEGSEANLDRQSSARWRTPGSNIAGSDTGRAGLPQPTLSTTAGQTDLLGFVYNARKGTWLLAAFVNGFS
jgi:hypothetical protein